MTKTILFLPAALTALLPVGAAQRDSSFMGEFRQAMEAEDRGAMEALVAANEQEALEAIVETCEAIAVRSSADLEREMDALAGAWQDAFDSRFAREHYEYLSLLSAPFKRSRAQLLTRFRQQEGRLEQAIAEGETSGLPAIGTEMRDIAGALIELGDRYTASKAHLLAAEAFDVVGEDANLARAFEDYRRGAELRAEIDLEDSLYAYALERADVLEYEGYGDPSKGPEARAAARAAADPSWAPKTLEGSFEPVPELTELPRPLYYADEIHPTWSEVWLQGNDSRASFGAMGESSPAVIRRGAADVVIDSDGDGEQDAEVPMSGTVELVETPLPDGRPWAFLATIGQAQDTYQGIQPFNLAPGDEALGLYVAPAASLVTELEGTPIRIFDDNMDGRYGGWPVTWRRVGLREGSDQPDFESMRIGDADRAVPWSRLTEVGDAWYRLELTEAPDVIQAQKVELETGTLSLDMDDVDVDWLVVGGTDDLEGAYFDLVAGGRRGLEVPAGTYRLVGGRVSEGKRQQMAKALVLPAPETASWSVTPGGETEVLLGGPFGFDFDFSQDDQSVTVDGLSVVVTGRGQETYQRLWNCAPQPEVHVRAVGGKRGKEVGELRTAQSQEEVIALGEEGEHGLFRTWFPIDETFEKPAGGEPAELRLVEKKNPLFGKIESDWQAE